MTKTRRSLVPRLAAVTVVVLAVAVGGMDAAYANTAGSITANINSSDPELIHCPNADGSMTMCLFTSQDMGDQPVPYKGNPPGVYGPNYYPMHQTVLWRYTSGTNAGDPANWHYQGPIFDETSLYGEGVQTNSYHLWAPGVRYWNGRYWLYIPDVINPNDESHSSRIFLYTTTDW